MVLDPGFDVVNAVELRQNPPRKSLHDFVDEQGIEELKTQLRQAIDEVQVPLRTYHLMPKLFLMVGLTRCLSIFLINARY